MEAQATEILKKVASNLKIPEELLLKQGLRSYLERQLRVVNADIFEICSRYGVKNVEDMGKKYTDGALEEAASWRDFQSLDHLEYKKDQLSRLLEDVS